MVTSLPALHIPTASELAEITDGVTAHDEGMVDACRVTINPIIAAATFSPTEINLPRLALTGTIITGWTYLLTGQLVHQCSTTDTELSIRIRHTTPVTGTQIGAVRLARSPYTGAGRLVTWSIPWKATFSGAASIFHSVLRTTGTGTTTLEGGEFTFAGMYLIDRNGYIRTVSS
jgi:hypothetical protein